MPRFIYKIKPALVLWLLFILFIFYGTLIPFDLSLDPENIRSDLGQANLIPFFFGGRIVSRMDIISNLLLFMVYGILFHSAFTKPKGRQPWIFPACVMSGFLLSTIIETCQIFSVSRVSSVTDISINTFAGGIGCGVSWIFHRFYKEKAANWIKGILSNRPLLLILLIYSSLVILNFLVPFDISIQVSDVWHSVKNINFIPFGNYQSYQDYFAGVGGELVIYLLLGFLINLCLIRYTRLSKAVASVYTIILVGVFSIGIEIAQIFFISRVTDVTDVVTGILGAMLGVFTCRFLNRQKLLIGLYIAFIFYYALAPFNFSFRANTLINSISIRSLVPFYAYWVNTTVFAFKDFIEGIVLYLPLGFLISLKNAKKSGFGFLYFLYGAAIALLMEFCQLFIIGRYFDITDVLLAGIGTSLGGWCYLKFSKYQEKEGIPV